MSTDPRNRRGWPETNNHAAQALEAMRKELQAELGMDKYTDADWAELEREMQEGSRQVLLAWIQDRLVIDAEELAAAWSCTAADLVEACGCGELYGIDIAGRTWYQASFARLQRTDVATLCRALVDFESAAGKLIFCERRHCGMGGLSVPQAIEARMMSQVLREVGAFAREHLPVPVAATLPERFHSMSTKATLKHGQPSPTGPAFHLYEDVMDNFSGDAAKADIPVYLQLQGVQVQVETLPGGGATVTVKLPRDIAGALGLLGSL